MDLAIIILCWHNQEYLPALLQSIAAQDTSLRFEVVICHNEPETRTRLAPADVPESLTLHEIFTGANLGYGGGNNFAISWIRQHAKPRYIFILNSDVILHDGALAAIVGWADQHPNMTAVGAVHIDPSRPQYRCYGGNRYNRVLSIITPNTSRQAADIDYVHGAAVLLRSAQFPTPEIFADRYFLFFEELDLAIRIRGMGKQIGFCRECRITHFEGASRKHNDGDFRPEAAEYFENLNALRLTREHYPYFLPTVLLLRGPGKFVYLFLRLQRRRLVFWALALLDFFRSRVRRFPFQSGWQPRLVRESLIDSDWP